MIKKLLKSWFNFTRDFKVKIADIKVLESYFKFPRNLKVQIDDKKAFKILV